MRVPHSVFRVIPALLLSLVTAIPLLAQSPATGAKSKSAQDNWDAPTQTAPSPQGSKAGKADTKNVADGAAKGQATEGIVKKRDMSSPDKVSGDGAAKGQAQELTLTDPNSNGGSGGKGNNSSVNDHKNISDGAAKSQAVDGMARNPNGGSGGKGNNSSVNDHKNISDGAAKSQAVDGMARNPNSGSGSGAGKSDSINYNASKSNTGNITIHKTTDSSSPQADMAVKGQGVPENTKKTKNKSATDDWNAPTSVAPQPSKGTTKGKSATDDWQSQN